jgi:MFS family permease
MYQQMEADEEVKRGDFLMVFTSKERFVKFVKCVVIGFPIWYSIGILVTLSPEFTKAIGVVGKVQVPLAIMLYYLGASIGDVLCGFGSHYLKSRKKIILIYILTIAAVLIPFFLAKGMPVNWYYVVVFFLGMGGGYWAILMTIATESFGTNLRATVTTTVPNFIRGSLTLITLLFTGLQTYFKPSLGHSNGLIWAGILTGVVCLGIPLLTIRSMEETYGKDLNYHEKD